MNLYCVNIINQSINTNTELQFFHLRELCVCTNANKYRINTKSWRLLASNRLVLNRVWLGCCQDTDSLSTKRNFFVDRLRNKGLFLRLKHVCWSETEPVGLPAGDPAWDQLQDVHQWLSYQTHPENHQIPAAAQGNTHTHAHTHTHTRTVTWRDVWVLFSVSFLE